MDSHTDFKVKSQGGAGAYCGGDLAAQLVLEGVSLNQCSLWEGALEDNGVIGP